MVEHFHPFTLAHTMRPHIGGVLPLRLNKRFHRSAKLARGQGSR